MRRLFVLASVLVLVLSSVPSFVTAAPEAVAPAAVRERVHGDPFALAPPSAWLPVLMETGDMQQAAMAAQASLRITYNLYPLGDANKDGKEDFLLENTTVDDSGDQYISESVVRAVSGGDFAQLWTVTVPDNSYWYVVGDVDLDMVEDLVIAKSTGTGTAQSQGAGPASAYRSERTTKYSYDVISGASGKTLFPLTCDAPYTYTYARASGPVGSARFADYKWTGCYLATLASGGGLDVWLESIIDRRELTLSAFVAGAFVRANTENLKITRYNGAGQKSWEWNFSGDNVYGYIAAQADFTGDRIDDFAYVVAPGEPVYVYGPVAGQGVALPESGKLIMVDGKTGKASWTIEIPPNVLEFAVEPVALRDAATFDLVLSEFHQVDAPVGAWQTRVRQINGATGASMDTRVLKDKIAAVMAHDDLDNDGRSELFMIQAKVEAVPLDYPEIAGEIELSAVKSDLTTVWGPLKFTDNDQWFEWMGDFDLNGDSINDFLVGTMPENAENEDAFTYRFHSGVDARPLWDYKLTSKVVSLEVIGDVDGTPGDDLAITVFDIPDEKLMKPAAPSTTAQPSPGSARTPGDSDEINYANYVGRLEIRRGTDRELIWEKKVHDPKDVQNVTANQVYSSTQLIPDTNGDGAPELLFNFQTPQYFLITSGGEWRIEEQRNGLIFALLINGLDGKTLQSYPGDKSTSPSLIGRAARQKAFAGEAGSGGNAPAPAMLLIVFALAVGVALRRRHA